MTQNNRIIMNMIDKIHSKFTELYGSDGTLYAASGRINLIGEHTDYNGGYVFPGAIDKGITAEIRLNGLDKVRVYSADYDESTSFGLNEEDKPAQAWARYIFGVCRETIKRGGKVEGFDAVFAGDVPLGAGLSSSAALESCFAFAINDLMGNNIDKFELARIGQSTEHNYCGVNCGIMDQFASCFGKKGSLMLLNCKTLEHKYYPFDPKGYKLVLLDSCVKHELASSAYNDRRRSCENAAAAIRRRHPEVEFLSDAKRLWLEEVRAEIPEEDFLRAEYVEVDPLDLLAYYGAASLPAVSVAGIARVVVAHVVCAYGERLCLDRCGEQQQYDRKKSFGGV